GTSIVCLLRAARTPACRTRSGAAFAEVCYTPACDDPGAPPVRDLLRVPPGRPGGAGGGPTRGNEAGHGLERPFHHQLPDRVGGDGDERQRPGRGGDAEPPQGFLLAADGRRSG